MSPLKIFDNNKILWLAVVLIIAGVFVMVSRSLNDALNLYAPRQETSMMEDSKTQSGDAITQVSQLPEVIEFKNAVEEGGRSTFHVERENFGGAPQGTTAIRVFEVFPDHQTTFGRYAVDENSKIYRYKNKTQFLRRRENLIANEILWGINVVLVINDTQHIFPLPSRFTH